MSIFTSRNNWIYGIAIALLVVWYIAHPGKSTTENTAWVLPEQAVNTIPVSAANTASVQQQDASQTHNNSMPVLSAAHPLDDEIKVPLESEELVRWRLERGYPDASNSYDSYDEATLNALADTGDVRASHKLAEFYGDRGELSDADREAIASLHRRAAVYGSTFAFLYLGMQQESAYTSLPQDDPKRHATAIEVLATYSVAALRGDKMPNISRGKYFVSNNNIQLTEEDERLIEVRAQEIYNNLSKHRDALALDEFDNYVPESVSDYFGEVEVIQKKLEARSMSR
jgi:hypothetical protein